MTTRCSACQYDLAGLPKTTSVCPECGGPLIGKAVQPLPLVRMYFYAFAPLIAPICLIFIEPLLAAILFLACLAVGPTFVALWVRLGAYGSSYIKADIARFWVNCILIDCALLAGVAMLL